jgi:hypothetical protein
VEGQLAAGEVATLVTDATPYVTAAVSAYGGAVLAKVRDDAADATVGVGRRFLQRVFGRHREGEPLPETVAELVEYPDDTDVLAALRLAIRRQLEADSAMLADCQAILASAPGITVTQNVKAGRDAYVAGRDMTINRPAQ